MRLVIDALTVSAGGALAHVISLANHVGAAGHDVSVICCDDRPYAARMSRGVRIDCPNILRFASRVNGCRLPVISLWRETRLPRMLRREDTIALNPNGIVPRRARKLGAFFTMSQNMLPFDGAASSDFVWRDRVKLATIRRVQVDSFRRAAGVVFISRFAAERILEVTGQLRHHQIIPLGVPAGFSRQPKQSYRLGPIIKLVYVSDFLPYKHHCEVISAVAGLARDRKLRVEIRLVGRDWSGMQRKVRVLAGELGLETQVRYLGYLGHGELAPILQDSDIALFASSCENCPTTLIEKMRVGLPVACSRLGPMPEVLGECGRYFDPFDPASIAKAIEDLLESEETRAQFGGEARRRSLAFDPDVHNRTIMEFFSETARIPS